MALIDKRTAHVLFTVLVFVAVLALLYVARRTFVAFLFAILFAYLLEPAVSRLQRWLGGSRGYAIATTYGLLVTLLVVFGIFLGPHVAQESQKLMQALPGLIEKVGSGQIAVQFGQSHGWSQVTQERLRYFLVTHRGMITQQVTDVARYGASLVTNIGWVVLIPILAIFFLRDKSTLGKAVLDLIDVGTERSFLRGVMSDLDQMLATYIRAQLLIALLALIVYTAFLLILGFPYGLVLGTVAGLLEFIPFVGPLITAVALLGIAFLTGYSHWLVVLIFLAVWRLLQDYVNTPYLMGHGLELHPLAAIFGILLGGEVAGVVGMFFSIPVIATVRILWRNWHLQGTAKVETRPATSPSPSLGT